MRSPGNRSIVTPVRISILVCRPRSWTSANTRSPMRGEADIGVTLAISSRGTARVVKLYFTFGLSISRIEPILPRESVCSICYPPRLLTPERPTKVDLPEARQSSRGSSSTSWYRGCGTPVAQGVVGNAVRPGYESIQGHPPVDDDFAHLLSPSIKLPSMVLWTGGMGIDLKVERGVEIAANDHRGRRTPRRA